MSHNQSETGFELSDHIAQGLDRLARRMIHCPASSTGAATLGTITFGVRRFSEWPVHGRTRGTTSSKPSFRP